MDFISLIFPLFNSKSDRLRRRVDMRIMTLPLSVMGLMCIMLSPSLSESQGFITSSPEFTVKLGTEFIIKYVPPVRNQGQVGLCYGFAAASAIDIATCMDENLTSDECSNLPPEKMASSLSLASNGNWIEYQKDLDSKPLQDKDAVGGGNSAVVLWNTVYGDGVYIKTEACYPFEPLIRYSEEDWEIIRKIYIKYHFIMVNSSSTVSVLDDLKSISSQIKNTFGIDYSASPDLLLKKISSPNYSTFVGELFDDSRCTNFVYVPQPWVWEVRDSLNSEFNNDKLRKKRYFRTYKEAYASIRDILQTNTAVLAQGFCALDVKPKTAEECIENLHVMLFVGYREVCTSAHECHDELKVHNSWGSEWQKRKNDGWFVAKEILDRTFYGEWNFVWLEPQ